MRLLKEEETLKRQARLESEKVKAETKKTLAAGQSALKAQAVKQPKPDTAPNSRALRSSANKTQKPATGIAKAPTAPTSQLPKGKRARALESEDANEASRTPGPPASRGVERLRDAGARLAAKKPHAVGGPLSPSVSRRVVKPGVASTPNRTPLAQSSAASTSCLENQPQERLENDDVPTLSTDCKSVERNEQKSQGTNSGDVMKQNGVVTKSISVVKSRIPKPPVGVSSAASLGTKRKVAGTERDGDDTQFVSKLPRWRG